jgi:hypothetical protein
MLLEVVKNEGVSFSPSCLKVKECRDFLSYHDLLFPCLRGMHVLYDKTDS